MGIIMETEKKFSAEEIQALKKADQDCYLHPTSSLWVLQEKGAKIIAKGKGCKVWDVEGKEYYDATAALWYSSVGHCRPDLAEAAKAQLDQLESYHSFNEFANVPAIQLAEKVSKMVPVKDARIFFTSGGSESNDTIFKMVRFYWYLKDQDSKDYIITRNRAYHGVSCGAVCATRLPGFHEGFEPLLPGFDNIEVPYCYQCPWGKEKDSCDLECAQALEDKIMELGKDKVAAFVAEPIIGTGGIIIPPPGYFEKIRKICDDNDVLFIADEVINAFGRTGKMFGIEHWEGVVPDIMTMAKGITSGYVQLGAVALSGEIFDTLKQRERFYHGFTYSGHPLACAVGLKNLEIIEKEGLTENSEKMGRLLKEKIQALDMDVIGEVRGQGLMVGVELVKNKETKEKHDPLLAPSVVEAAYELGLITRPLIGDILQFSPPMVITESEINDIVKILEKAIAKALKARE
jgi:putrescine aminotransferase